MALGAVCDPEEVYRSLRDEPHTRIEVGNANIDVAFFNADQKPDRRLILSWIRTGALAVAEYFGRYPVAHAGILVVPEDGNRVVSGTTYGFDTSAICVRVGRNVDAETLRKDWVLVHEMTHLALPVVPRQHEWLLEGNATYVEPIARAQVGQLDAATVWRWTLEGMPKGLPKAGDRGLDGTPTWGRTYWGGALFWLLADIRIQQRTEGRLGVQDALRAINRSSGGNTTRWSVDQVVAVGDRATGTHVLAGLYKDMKATPVSVDLNGLFRDLGVSERDGTIVFDDLAPLARIRERITSPHAMPDRGHQSQTGVAPKRVMRLAKVSAKLSSSPTFLAWNRSVTHSG
jgi:hypothetical protein